MSEPVSLASPQALDFMLSRRSRPAKILGEPGPDRDTLKTIMTAAVRAPDHGKLEPWRLLVIEGAARGRLADAAVARAEELGKSEEDQAKARRDWLDGAVIIAVVAAPKPSEKIPEIEQTLSAGCVCLSLLNAALASGWGANWLSGWRSYDRPFLETQLGLAPSEWVAGYIHIGTAMRTPPERPRPDLDAITQYIDR